MFNMSMWLLKYYKKYSNKECAQLLIENIRLSIKGTDITTVKNLIDVTPNTLEKQLI